MDAPAEKNPSVPATGSTAPEAVPAPEANPFSLKGKTVLVTGASSGIGRAVAVECAKLGARVFVSGRDESRLAETLALLGDGNAHESIAAELTDAAARDALADRVPALNGVVQNAGINRRMPCRFIKEADSERIFRTNLEAPILLQKALLRKKKLAAGASVVFTASLAALRPSTGNAVYAATKAGVIAYARVAALELAPQKIRVNCILPGMVRTNILNEPALDADAYAENEKSVPLGRYGVPADIAPLVAFLLSDASSWMTGTAINIDGGAGLC